MCYLLRTVLFASRRSQDNSQLQVRGLPNKLMDRTWEECRVQGGKELKLQLKYTENQLSQALTIRSELFPESHGVVMGKPFC